MRIENIYNDVYYTRCNDVGENTGGYFVQFYSDADFVDEIDYMVLHKDTEEVSNPEKYIHEYIINEKLDLLVARKAIQNGVKDNPRLLEIVDTFMNEGDNKALEQLYEITEDKLLKILISWKDEYGDIIDNPQTNVSYMYNDIIGYIWDKYKLNEMKGELKNNITQIENTNELIKTIEDMDVLDIRKVKRIVNTLNMFERSYTNELKEIILDKLDEIEKNNLQDKYSLEILKEDIISSIKEIANIYNVDLEDDNEIEEQE